MSAPEPTNRPVSPLSSIRARAARLGAAVRRTARRARDEFFGGQGPAMRKEAAFLREFKPDATAIEERPVPVSVHAVLYVLCALLLTAIIWSFIGTIDRTVVAQGKVTTTAPVIVLQPFGVSRILAIRVKPGTRVHKGDVLMSFDPVFATADVSSIAAKARVLKVTRERMEAELDGRPFDAGINPTPERASQAEIYSRRKAQLTSELAARDSDLKKLADQREAIASTIKRLTKQLKLAHEVTDMRQKLKDKQIGSELQLVTAKKEELAVEQSLQEATSKASDLVQEVAQAQAERDAFVDNWHRQSIEDLVTTRQQAREAEDALAKALRLREFTSLTAPVDGTVLEIADRSIGSVMREAETAVTLVPANAPLEVEADVLSKDVGYVSVGNAVRIKLEAYPFQKFGAVDGTLAIVSPDSIVRKKGDASLTVYHVTIRLKDPVKLLATRGITLRPGLIAVAEITTGRRSIASYLLYPVWRMFDESLKEP